MLAQPNGIGLLKNTSRPHGALLFMDYATSREGQALMYSRGRNVAYPGMEPILNDANLLIDDPDSYMDNLESWQKLFKDLLITPNKRR